MKAFVVLFLLGFELEEKNCNFTLLLNAKIERMSVQTIYDTYLHQLSHQERLELIRLLVDETIPPTAALQDSVVYNVMDFSGVGKVFAMEEDAQIYVDNLRKEWD